MKKLNLLALVVLVSVNVFTPSSYAQETGDVNTGESGSGTVQQNETPTETSGSEEPSPTITMSYADNVAIYTDTQGNQFNMGTITITDGTNSITMFDRNLGATDIRGEEAYGYHFQRGNNYGFDWRNIPDHAVGQVDASNYGWNHPYVSNIFMKLNKNRDSSNNPNLWGGMTAEDYAMQGPCPAGYHVPSIYEWGNVLKMYHDMNPKGSTLIGSDPTTYKVDNLAFRKAFQDAFYISFAGFRNLEYKLENQQEEARFWTSTPSDSKETESRRFYMGTSIVDSLNSKDRAYGYSVRCFKNSDSSTNTITVSFDTRGGSVIQPQVLPQGYDEFLPQTPVKENDKFLGWYTDKELNTPYIYAPLDTNMKLYAKWRSDVVIYKDNATTYTDTLGNVFNMGSITVTDGISSITILDRNLGATATKGEDSYGYHFQWGNNYGFPWYDEIQLSNEAVDASGYNWQSPYVSGTFIKGVSAWDSSNNNDLWGDIVDEEYARQGPCPDGYHVPTAMEWEDLIDLYGIAGQYVAPLRPSLVLRSIPTEGFSPSFKAEFQEVFNIPLANRRKYSNGQIEQLGKDVRIWSSTPGSEDDKSFRLYIGGNDDVIDIKENERAHGYSVRCFKNVDDSNNIVLSYEVDGGTAIQAQTLPKGSAGYLPGYTTSKAGDELLGWYSDSNLTTPFDFNSPVNENTTIYAKRASSCIVTFKDWDERILKQEVVHKGESAVAPANPSRNGYTFKGWDKPINNITQDEEIYAVYEKNDTGGYSGGGGGGGSSHKSDSKGDGPSTEKKDTTPTEDKQPQENEHKSAPEKVEPTIARGNSDPVRPEENSEMRSAYSFAYSNGITSKSTYEEAKVDKKLTRIEMAKMLSQYAINVLDQTPDPSRGMIKFNDVTNKMNKEYDDAVTLAYELGIMGINMPNNEFRPNDYVTRGEFVTALSRMVYGTSDGQYKQTSKYYTLHMQKLESEQVMTQVNPTMMERRGYVMIMLMRLASKI